MRIVIHTQDPERLKSHIITDVENGNLPTWEIRTNKNDDRLLTYSSDQWADRVLLRLTPSTPTHQLVVEPRHWSDIPRPTNEESGTVLGRFCERLFVQYSAEIQSFTVYL